MVGWTRPLIKLKLVARVHSRTYLHYSRPTCIAYMPGLQRRQDVRGDDCALKSPNKRGARNLGFRFVFC